MSDYIVKIYTPQELNHSSYIQTGLFELERDSFIKTKVVLSLAKRLGTIRVTDSGIKQTNQPHPKTSFYQLIDTKSGRKINFAADLYDSSDSFSAYALEHCDYIFKRNFEAKNVEKLPKEARHKIHPLGLVFGTHSKHQEGILKFFLGLLLTNLSIDSKADRNFLKRIRISYQKQISHWKFTRTTRLIDHFEKVTPFTENSVFFQTRCFSSEEQEDVKQIHQQRFRIIVLLKEKFKEKFKGGIMPSALANEKYKEALTNLPTDPVSYLNMVKSAKVVIYSRGLLYSPAWKMPEYLSQGKIIVAEKLTAELLVPLEHGKEVLFFEDENQLIPLIEEVLKNDDLCEKLSQNAKKYFDTYVHPKENVKRILNFMLSQKV
ncbi:glycosyltransferase [Flavobacterium sp.]|uniref:glycosyltransferase n=1 Tax=Flavobacterium sp. TaxID=239 RepID=UPI003D6C6222